MKNQLQKDQTVYVLEFRDRSASLVAAEVVKVGRKYITVSPNRFQQIRFYVNDKGNITHDNGDYSPRYKLYTTREEYQEQVKRSGLVTFLREKFGIHSTLEDVSTSKLEAIKEIIDNPHA